ncbi:MAG: (d)CMP kinase [Burkholderiales bacterium]
MNNISKPPVIAIDGPSGAGKGTVAELAARKLGFHYLDSGAIYRAVALAVRKAGVDFADHAALATLAQNLPLRFENGEIWLGNEQVSEDIRSEQTGEDASKIASIPLLRQALLARQRAFLQPPGLVADGRDMGTVVFPQSGLKIFLTASAEARAERRTKQLKQKGIEVRMCDVLKDLQQRDSRDSSRVTSPLQQSKDARLLDTSDLSIEQAVEQVLKWYRESQ